MTDSRIMTLMAAPAALNWLTNSRSARVLHVFNRSCNLISDNGSILSIVNKEIGPGPFTLVVDESTINQFRLIQPWGLVDVASPVKISDGLLRIGDVTICSEQAAVWDPRPDWASVEKRNLQNHGTLIERMVKSRSRVGGLSGMLSGEDISDLICTAGDAWRKLETGFRIREATLLQEGASRLAGLGNGLTPAGDDFLMGVIYSFWVSREAGEAAHWAKVLVDAASQRTTSLSAAWLKAASRGETNEPWHRMVKALGQLDSQPVSDASKRIMEIGHSSGLDALSGFVLGLRSTRLLQ